MACPLAHCAQARFHRGVYLVGEHAADIALKHAVGVVLDGQLGWGLYDIWSHGAGRQMEEACDRSNRYGMGRLARSEPPARCTVAGGGS
jgi:hypothetical protein